MAEIALWIWGSIATIVAVGAAWVRLRAGNGETTVAVWRDEALAWRAKAERLESAIAELTRRVENLEAENKVLRTLHDSRAELVALREAVDEVRALLVAGR